MRLQAKVELTYAGKEFRPGMLFDALERDGLELVNSDQAVRFHLEDPSTRSLDDALRDLLPPETPTMAAVSIEPTTATVLAEGGTGSILVTIEEDGTWVVGAHPDWVSCDPVQPQTASGMVSYVADPNSSGLPRQARIDINGNTFTLNQGAV